jgi:hypothetical protein
LTESSFVHLLYPIQTSIMVSSDKSGLEAAHPKANMDEKSAVVASDVSSTVYDTPGELNKRTEDWISPADDYDGELPDPDVGKTDEERAALVLPPLFSLGTTTLTPRRTKLSSERWISG